LSVCCSWVVSMSCWTTANMVQLLTTSYIPVISQSKRQSSRCPQRQGVVDGGICLCHWQNMLIQQHRKTNTPLRLMHTRYLQTVFTALQSFIHSGCFNSTYSSPLLLRGAPDYCIDYVSELIRQNVTGNCKWRTCWRSVRGGQSGIRTCNAKHRTCHLATTPCNWVAIQC